MKSQDNKSVIVPLQGGLGNQLFQLAFAMAYSYPGNSYLEIDQSDQINYGKYELGLMNFILPKNIFVIDFNSRNKIFYHLRNFLTRMSTYTESNFRRILIFIGGILLKLEAPNITTRKTKIITANGVGFDGTLISSKNEKPNYVIGYFQSYKWFSRPEVQSAFKKISLKDESENVNLYAKFAITETPLIMHLRFGDYLDDKTFKVHTDYYNLALKYLKQEFEVKNIWIFSDDENRARKILEIDDDLQVRWIVGSSILPHEVFEIMRFGTSYIISNSSFSYWAAQMSHSSKPFVIAPAKWFETRAEPMELCPKDWIRM